MTHHRQEPSSGKRTPATPPEAPATPPEAPAPATPPEAPAADSSAQVFSESAAGRLSDPGVKGGRSLLAGSGGMLVAGGFYALVWASGWAPLERYFLGHPVAVVATVLFWLAVAVLVQNWWRISAEWSQFRTIRDEDLLPPEPDASPAGRWLTEHDAGHVARGWLTSLGQLSRATRSSQLVKRLVELLTRQTQRGTAKHLADDLRELSDRDADAAHDSLGLVRIIVWAIPMLGFLGTVIGITQTLGGLDFSDGTAAVDRLKSGLYVAFDTTALGLVLSVVAIFIQFPIERSEQRLLAAIDARVGNLLSSSLPSDDAGDNQTALVADLCEGIQAAVAQSLESQAQLWRRTIDEANDHWQDVRQRGADELVSAVRESLAPALRDHADALQQSLHGAGDRVASQSEQLASRFETALRDHSGSIDESARFAGDRLERQTQQWREMLDASAETLRSHHHDLANQCRELTETNRAAESVQRLQLTLDSGLERLRHANHEVARSVEASAGDGMADAMRILARAVDTLSAKLPERPAATSAADDAKRHAA